MKKYMENSFMNPSPPEVFHLSLVQLFDFLFLTAELRLQTLNVVNAR